MEKKVVYDIETTFIHNGYINVVRNKFVYAEKEFAENVVKKLWDDLAKDGLYPDKIEVIELPILF